MFYDRLKKLCDINNTSPTAVTIQLGMSKGSIANWKKGTVPNGDAVVRFAEHFGVSTDYLLLGKNTPYIKENSLSDEDLELLELYNSLDDKAKIIIKGKLYEYEEQNLKKQTALAKEANNILPINTNKKEYINLTVYNQKASAGIGKYMVDDVDYEEQQFELTAKNQKADHAIIIEGDSMYPTIEDTQYVFVKEQSKIEHGEIGIFVYEDNVYCKRLCIDKKNKHIILVSDNQDYDDIIVENINELRTIGKVIL